MDPALQEILAGDLDPDEEIEAIIRLHKPSVFPPRVRVISQFGDVITCRVQRKNIRDVYEHDALISFKASRFFYADEFICDIVDEEGISYDSAPEAFNENVATQPTGKGIVIGLLDWGCDFAHADFINLDNTTRLLALWDQGNPNGKYAPYGYGTYYSHQQINNALLTDEPYRTLGYHPGGKKKKGAMHGTHVMGICASNGNSGVRGIAPEAELVFVHLAANDTDGLRTLGDSVRILEGIDFVKKIAGEKPVVINLSIGKCGGSHDGTSLIERAIDNSEIIVCQSTGNYFNSGGHTEGIVKPGGKVIRQFIVGSQESIPELEVWYSGLDEFGVSLQHQKAGKKISCPIDSSSEILINGSTVGKIYHRSLDPTNQKNHIDIFLYKNAPPGQWSLELSGLKILDGRLHAWIERDTAQWQSKFVPEDIVVTNTTNTICNGYCSIATGAIDTTKVPNELARFSSSGPTTDGRIKPAILAPGVGIVSSKSSSQDKGSKATVSMTGTSMASPVITGAVALILQIKSPLTIHQARSILFECVEPWTEANDQLRSGYGVINLDKLRDYLNTSSVKSGANPLRLPYRLAAFSDATESIFQCSQ